MGPFLLQYGLRCCSLQTAILLYPLSQQFILFSPLPFLSNSFPLSPHCDWEPLCTGLPSQFVYSLTTGPLLHRHISFYAPSAPPLCSIHPFPFLSVSSLYVLPYPSSSKQNNGRLGLHYDSGDSQGARDIRLTLARPLSHDLSRCLLIVFCLQASTSRASSINTPTSLQVDHPLMTPLLSNTLGSRESCPKPHSVFSPPLLHSLPFIPLYFVYNH